MGSYPGDVEQQCSAVHVGDLRDDLAGIIQSLVVVDTLTDELRLASRERQWRRGSWCPRGLQLEGWAIAANAHEV